MRIMKMDHLSSHHIAGTIGILCFLALGSVQTVEKLTADNNEGEETDDSEEDESGLSGTVLLGFWLMCFLGILAILLRLVRDDNNLLYRAVMGVLALYAILSIATRIAANHKFFSYHVIVAVLALLAYVYELCRRHSPLAASAWFCTAQMWGVCALLSLAVFLLLIDVILVEPFDAFDWISLVILIICTVSSFVVATLAPPVHVAQEEPSVPGTEFELM
jgi:hypothetical protein